MSDTSKLPVSGSTRVNLGAGGGNWAQNEAQILTGSTVETELARILLPGGFIGKNGEMNIHVIVTNNNSVGAKTLKVNLGNVGAVPVNLLTHANTTDTFDFGNLMLANRNATNSQLLVVADFNIVPAGLTEGIAIDTEADMILTVTGTLANGADTMSLEAIDVVTYFRD